ncbi:MAG TPA: diacylglycerol kinase family protein [Polyangiales bacterium]|nr:diacylglycerol kinase family protein [Polyangiales bacterium]
MAGIGIIFNPRSGHFRRHPGSGLRLARALGSHGIVREVSSIEALYRAAEEFRGLDIELLGISGGDGTNSTTLSGFLEVYGERALPPIALLRGGTANTLADSMGVPHGRPERQLARLVRAYRQPLRHVERRMMQVRGENSRRCDALTDAPRYGFLFGTGVVAGYLREYYAAGQPSAWVASKTLLRGIGSTLVRGPMIRRMAKPFHGSVELDDGTAWQERDYFAVAAGTIEQIGLGFKPFYRSHECLDAFHLLGIHTSPWGFVQQLPNVRRGRTMGPEHTHEALAKHVKLHASERRLTYMVDGDLYECEGGLELSLGPALKIVATEQSQH